MQEGVLDQVAMLVERFVVRSGLPAVLARGLTARRKRVRIDAPIGAVWAHLSALLERSD